MIPVMESRLNPGGMVPSATPQTIGDVIPAVARVLEYTELTTPKVSGEDVEISPTVREMVLDANPPRPGL